jgi:hypothetical protein
VSESVNRYHLVAQHVDAIRAIIRPDRVLAILAADPDGRPYFICPEWNIEPLEELLRHWRVRLGGERPT